MTFRKQLADAKRLQQSAEQIRMLGRRVKDDIVEIGRLLSECKGRLPHGEWGQWLKSEFGWSERTALRFMQCHKLAKSDKLSDLKNLSIDASALYLLAAPKTPQAVRDDVVSRARAGEPITRKVVMQVREETLQIKVPHYKRSEETITLTPKYLTSDATRRTVDELHGPKTSTDRPPVPECASRKFELDGDIDEVVGWIIDLDRQFGKGFALRVVDKLSQRITADAVPAAGETMQ